jgi:hypothetical protein
MRLAFAQFFFGPGRWQAGTVLLVFGIPRDDSDCPKHAMNPGNEMQPPIGGIQADDTGTDLIQAHCPGQQRLCKRSIVGVSRGEQKEDRQARAATEKGMDPEATQKRARMVSGSMAKGRIGITTSPGQDGSTVNDEITRANESSSQRLW